MIGWKSCFKSWFNVEEVAGNHEEHVFAPGQVGKSPEQAERREYKGGLPHGSMHFRSAHPMLCFLSQKSHHNICGSRTPASKLAGGPAGWVIDIHRSKCLIAVAELRELRALFPEQNRTERDLYNLLHCFHSQRFTPSD